MSLFAIDEFINDLTQTGVCADDKTKDTETNEQDIFDYHNIEFHSIQIVPIGAHVN